jgi:hypothetical protein
VTKRRAVFAADTPPAALVGAKHQGDWIDVVGIPRMSLKLLKWRIDNFNKPTSKSKRPLDWNLPYELVIAAVIDANPPDWLVGSDFKSPSFHGLEKIDDESARLPHSVQAEVDGLCCSVVFSCPWIMAVYLSARILYGTDRRCTLPRNPFLDREVVTCVRPPDCRQEIFSHTETSRRRSALYRQKM